MADSNEIARNRIVIILRQCLKTIRMATIYQQMPLPSRAAVELKFRLFNLQAEGVQWKFVECC